MPIRIDIPDNIVAVVLDMDGTIYSKPNMAWYMLCKQWHHLPSLVAERRWRKAQRKALQVGGEMPPMPVDEQWYRRVYLPSMVQIIAEHYKPQEWVHPLLATCKQRGIKVVILSDYEAVEDKLRVLGLDVSAFDAVLATGDFGTIKPAPRLGSILAQHLCPESGDTNNAAICWRHVLFVGDRQDTDGQLARSLGAKFILV